MNWRLGLDLGTNSLGWSVLELDDNKQVVGLKDLGVRIFSDGRNPKTNEPLAVARRTARGQRKIIYRRKLRRKQTFRLLQQYGFFPKEKQEAKEIKNLNPYELRVKALDSKLEPFELGRVLFNLSVRRGFKSNRKDSLQEESNDSSYKKKLSQSDMCFNLEKAVIDSGARTLGEFLWKNQDQNHGIRFVPDRMIYYPTRKMYEAEFEKIKAVQAQFYPNLDWNKIFDSIFFQRPLKPQERGFCQYDKTKERTFKAMPCSQKLRILQEVRNLKYYDESGKCTALSQEQENIVVNLLNTKEKVTFDAIRKSLKLSDACSFNLEANREDLKGNVSAVKMRSKNRFGSMWDSFTLHEQDEIVEKLITADEDEQVLEMLQKYALSDEQKKSILKLNLQGGTSMLCSDISETLVAILENNSDYDYSMAVESLGYDYGDQSVEKYDELPYYGKVLVGSTMGVNADASEENPEKKYGKIGNPTVHVALNQTRVVVNALIKKYGKPTQISVELSRELKSSREEKTKILQRQTQKRKDNAVLNKELSDIWKIAYPNRSDRLKYRLWKELEHFGHKCLYCGKELKSEDLFTTNIQIEHILPYSRTLLDAESNLTIVHASCNQAKGNKSPFEAFGTDTGKYNWQDILERAHNLKNKAKSNKFSPNAMDEFNKDSSFIARQLTDNAYLSKAAYRYLHSICDDVWTVNGGMTKLLRDKWEIDSILCRKFDPQTVVNLSLTSEQISEYKKNRKDHRHHAMDAVVIALTDRSLVKEISTLNAKSFKNRIEVPELPIHRDDFIYKVKNIVVSFKPDHGAEGKLSKEALLGKIKKEERIDIKNLKIEDIPFIKTERVRNEIQTCLKETNDLKAVQKQFKDIYPQIVVYKEYFVSRENLSNFETEKDLESIVDKTIQSKIQSFITNNSDLGFKDAIQKFMQIEWVGKPRINKKTGKLGPGKKYKITKVRCYNRVQAPIEINNSEVPRYLAPEDYFAAVVWRIPPAKEGKKFKYEAQFIRRDQVGKDNKPKIDVIKAPHPAAKNIGIIYKGEYLEFSDNGKFYKCRVAGYSATQNKLDIRPIYSVTDCKEWLDSTDDTMIEKCWKPQHGHNYISVNVLFGEKDAHMISVNPIGKVYRKK